MKLLLPGLLCAAVLTLCGGIAYEALAPLDPVTVEHPRVAAHTARIAAPAAYVAPSIDLFADIDARPLFSATRQPLQDTTATGAVSSDFVLVGVIMGGEHSVALLRNKSTSSTTSAAVGDVVGGWRVARIDATTVTLRSSTGEFVVPLDGPANQPPSTPLAPVQSAPASAPAQPPPTPPLTTAPQAAPSPPIAATAPARSGLPTRPAKVTIAPEALRGAPIDPKTGEPTL
jgi:hypothetical protein